MAASMKIAVFVYRTIGRYRDITYCAPGPAGVSTALFVLQIVCSICEHARMATEEFVQGLQRGFAVIRAFSADAPTLTITQAADRTGLTRAVARRYLLTLERLGYVAREAQAFTLTPRILDVGFAYLSTITVADVAQPHMERVVQTLHESCSLWVLDGTDIVMVARVPTKRIMTVNLVVGSRLAAHATSAGKVLLAHLPPDRLDAYFAAARLQKLTPRTMVTAAALRRALADVRRAGAGTADEESEAGLRAISVPVFDRGSRVVAALTVSGHAARVSIRELRQRYLPVLSDAAAQISRALGARTGRGE
jgi:IclR family transcriptional regulator, pca regulon regulatory protein